MAFHNVPPNGFPDLPDMEELEAVVKDLANVKTSVAGLATDVSNLNDNKANQITIAPFFSAETAYEVGDLVYYNGLTYRCTNDHDGEWDADDFAATTISNELDTLKSGLTNITTWYDEGIFNDEKTISSAFEQLKFYETNSSGGTVFSELTVLGEWVPQVIALNKVIISRSGNTYTITNNPDSRYIRILSNRVG